MANSKLLKEAIADAKAVKETALANAKIALEEAFTPRLQSILSKKLQAEAEEEATKDQEQMSEELDSSEIGTSDANKPKEPAGYEADYDLGPDTEKSTAAAGAELEDYEKVKDLNEEESDDDEMDIDMDSEEGDDEEYEITGDEEEDTEEADEDEMDLEAIIRELESQIGEEEEADAKDEPAMEEDYADGEEAGTDKGEDPKVVVSTEIQDVTKASGKAPRGSFDTDSISEEEDKKEETDEVIDLEEILKEMEADLADDAAKKDDAEKNEMKKSLKEAYNTIHSLRKTLNEVNLLNAKLLFANKLFRAHNMTNEQKVKVIETLDRTKSVREVKLVYSTLAENFKYTGTNGKVVKKSITEGIASKVVKSTKPEAAKQVIAESADVSDRFKKLAGIIK